MVSAADGSRTVKTEDKQIIEAEQRQREREEREAAEARQAQDADRAAYYAKQGWPDDGLRPRGARRRHRGCPPWIALGVKPVAGGVRAA